MRSSVLAVLVFGALLAANHPDLASSVSCAASLSSPAPASGLSSLILIPNFEVKSVSIFP